jgi:DNA uptake protein ComE-like DNA-binding protein
MNTSLPSHRRSPRRAPGARGSVLIIVLWIAFGLVSIALYFGHSMVLSFRAADNQTAGLEAEQAIEGAVRYVGFMLTNETTTGTNLALMGMMLDTNLYEQTAAPVGEATFWLMGRADGDAPTELPAFGLIDEASKLNLNTATRAMLEGLPMMTPELAAAIIDWRDADSTVTEGGAEAETYLRLPQPYNCKNANFETVEELRLVRGASAELLYGEDLNRNGVLDANENDGELSPPLDNRDGRLDPGLLEYLTVYSREPNKRSDGSDRINLNGGNVSPLQTLLRQTFGASRANQILARAGPLPGRTYGSVLEFYLRSRMTTAELSQVADALAVTNAAFQAGLINVNTASAAVLACVPGIGADNAQALVAYRQTHPQELTSLAWVAQALGQDSAIRAGPYLTIRSYQFTADIAAVGHYGRGYRRTLFVFDVSEGAPRVLYRRDLGRLGWALGSRIRTDWLLANENPR